MNTKQAAKSLKISNSQVKRLLKAGWLKGIKILQVGSIKPVWQIDLNSVNKYSKNRRPRGRPAKQHAHSMQ